MIGARISMASTERNAEPSTVVNDSERNKICGRKWWLGVLQDEAVPGQGYISYPFDKRD